MWVRKFRILLCEMLYTNYAHPGFTRVGGLFFLGGYEILMQQ